MYFISVCKHVVLFGMLRCIIACCLLVLFVVCLFICCLSSGWQASCRSGCCGNGVSKRIDKICRGVSVCVCICVCVCVCACMCVCVCVCTCLHVCALVHTCIYVDTTFPYVQFIVVCNITLCIDCGWVFWLYDSLYC